jgi:hypothetical protein
VDQHIILTDSLSNIVAQEGTFTRGNSKRMVLKDLMAEEGSNVKLMWVPVHVEIKGNETADKVAKEALNQEMDNTYKVVKSDWSKWVKRKSWQVRQDEWKASENIMATVKLNRYSSTEGLPGLPRTCNGKRHLYCKCWFQMGLVIYFPKGLTGVLFKKKS